jgi:hypothetical protein
VTPLFSVVIMPKKKGLNSTKGSKKFRNTVLSSGTHSSKSEQSEAQVFHLLKCFFFTFGSGCFFQQLVANKDSLEAQISVNNVPVNSQACPPVPLCSYSGSSFEDPSIMESEINRIPAKRVRPVGVSVR